MAYALTIDVIERTIGPEGEDVIRMSLTFWGDSEAECEQTWGKLKHMFEFFAAAEREGRTVEEMEEIDDDERPCPECDR